MYRLPRWLLPQNHLGPGTCNSATYPEVLCSESVTSPSSLLRPHVPIRGPLTGCAFGSFGESSQLRPPAAGPPDLPDVISANLSLDAWTSTPGVAMVHLPVSSHSTSAFPPLGPGRHLASVHAATSTWARFRGCSHSCCLGLQVCLPPRSLLPIRPSPYGSRDFYFQAP